MTDEEKILLGIKALGNGNTGAFIAIVVNNYPDGDSIDVKDLSGTLYPEVRKRASLKEDKSDKQGIIITPASGSYVIVNRIGSSDELFISMFSDIESILIDGGVNFGLVKVKELTERLNTLESDINKIKEVFKLWVTVPGDGGASLKSATALWAGQSLSKTKQKDIENDKIKH